MLQFIIFLGSIILATFILYCIWSVLDGNQSMFRD